ncbi:MAG: GNAT family N-acetyltransferase, partial [Rhodothermales bacterium]
MKVLVIEDAHLMAIVMQRHLTRMGYDDIKIVESAEEALDYLKLHKVGLFIIDWSLPGMSGLELVKKLRAHEHYCHKPMLMVTGHNEREEVVEALQSGVDEYLIKPVHYEVLAEKLEHLFAIRIRPADPGDAETLSDLIVELAEYEKLAFEAAPDPEDLRRHLSPKANPRCEALLAEHVATGQTIGFALFFQNYSTFLTRWGMYLEDLYVKPAFRGRGAGIALFKRVAEIAIERRCERLDWSVLDWNTLAIDFYRKLGARTLDDWTRVRLSGKALHQLARHEASESPGGAKS